MRTRSCRTGTLIALSTVTVLALGACSSGGEAGTTKSGVPLVQAGKLVACTQLPYRPFEFNDASGKIVGFDIDVVTEVAKDLKVTPQIVDTPFEGIQTGDDLTTGKCDLAAAGITITAVREKAFDFSQPYFDATQALLVKTGSKVSSLKDLSGKKLGVQQATTGEIYATKNAPGAEVVQFEDLALLETAVQTGQVDAAINDNGVLFDFAKSNHDVKVAVELKTDEKYGLGVKTGNTALVDAINKTLVRIKADGTYDTLYAKWFGTAPVGK